MRRGPKAREPLLRGPMARDSLKATIGVAAWAVAVALPLLLLVPFGWLWLWQKGFALYWLGAALVISFAAFGLRMWLLRRLKSELELGEQARAETEAFGAPREAAARATVEHPLRSNAVHTITRENTGPNIGYRLPIVHWEFETGSDELHVKCVPKGSGSENMSFLKMCVPADGVKGIKQFVLESIVGAGGKPCPPGIVGVGIGFYAAHQVNKTPQGRAFFEDVDSKAREFRDAVVEGYKAREAELRAAVADAEDVIADLTKRSKG